MIAFTWWYEASILGPVLTGIRELDTAAPGSDLLDSRLMAGVSGENPLEASCSVLAIDPTGTHVLTVSFQLGRIDNGVFTALPGAPVPEAVAAAW